MPMGDAPTVRYGANDDSVLAADAVAVHRALSKLIRIYQFRDRDRICCYDISVTQCYALEALVLDGPLSVNELAAALYLDKSTTSRVADALGRKGYLERNENPADRRALLMQPSEAGRKLHARIEAEILAQEQDILTAFAPEVRRSMAELITKLGRAAASRINASGGTCTAVTA